MRNAKPTKARLKVIEEKLGNPLHQDAASRRVANPMAAAWESQNFDMLPRFDEIVNHRERIRVMHVVVAGAVSNEQFALKLRGIFHR